MSLDHFLPDAFFGEPELNQITPAAVAELVSTEKFSHTRRYLNFTGKFITVIERSGIRHEFASIPSYNRSSFVIVSDWRIHKSMHESLVNFIKQERENESKLIRRLRELILDYKPTFHDQNQFMYLRTEENIQLADLEAHRGEIYDHEHDVVVSTWRGNEAGPHPYSAEGRAIVLLNNAEKMGENKAFCETIQIVDNDGKYGDRFINRNKNVYRIEATQDHSKASGVWVIRNKPFENTRLPSQMGWRRYSFEEADTLLELYKTYAEALHCGDAEHKRKEEMLHAETALTRERSELAEQKIRHQREMQNWEMERTRAQVAFERQQAAYADEQFRAKMALDRTKNQYEQQMLDMKASAERRKETSEWMKQIPAILGALGVAWLTYQTAKYAAKRVSKEN
jgi:hypothetical protein